jgi:uncharacterized protein YbjQ (UPF0145 family)
MRVLQIFAPVLTLLMVSGCGSFVPVVKLDELSETQRHQVRQMQILNQAQLIGKNYSIETIVEGNSCQNKLWDPPATRTAAIEQLKFHAFEAGGDAITNIQCSGREGTSARTNCWELISCTAEAIKFKK